MLLKDGRDKEFKGVNSHAWNWLYPTVNTEAVCLFSTTSFLWGPSQELVLESGEATASTHLTSYILWLTKSES